MKKWLIPVGIIVVLGIVIYSMTAGFYNNANKLQKQVTKTWGDVEISYQRRSDLIPNLVRTVKGAANFEKSTLTEVVEARAKATSININASDPSAAQIKQFQEAQSGLSSALSRLLVSVERYPKLTATQNFSNLQAQLEGTENRIAVARRRYNEAVTQYNTKITSFPNLLFASSFGFEEMPVFQAEKGAEKAPKVEF